MKSLRYIFSLTLAALATTTGAQNNDDANLPELTHSAGYLQAESSTPVAVDTTKTTDDVYRERLKRLPTVIDMPYNEVVRDYIEQYTGRLSPSVSYMLGQGQFYIPLFEEALDLEGLPLELKYLPVIESGLDPSAVSRAGAVGLWQFMLPTARKYDLTVNSLVDERRDPVKSTRAAARYLSDLYNTYGNWMLALAAYNCGPTNVNKAIRRADGIKDYWTIYPYLPQETRGYVPAFIAANYVMNYYCQHSIQPQEATLPAETDTIMVERNLHVGQIAALTGVDSAQIRLLNPQYLTDIIPGGRPEPCALRLPADKTLALLELGDSVYNYKADVYLARVPKAVPAKADTRVAQRTTTKINSRQASNNAKRQARQSKNAKKTKGKGSSVTIKSGDSLYELARRHNTTVEKIKKLNSMKSNMIKPGQKIRVK